MSLKINSKLFKISLSLVSFLLLLPACSKSVQIDNEDIARKCLFISTRNIYRDIYSINSDGTDIKQLTNDKAHYASPGFMNNGRICFASKLTGVWQIYTMDLNGKNIKAVTKDRAINNYEPFPTPEGKIVFLSDRDENPEIFVINEDGTQLTQLTYNHSFIDCPVVLDDGRIFFISSKSTKNEVWIMNGDGAGQKKLTSTKTNIVSIALLSTKTKDFLPKTEERTGFVEFRFMAQPKIIYAAKDTAGDTQLYRINMDGTDKRTLTSFHGENTNPVVLPGGQVSFMSDTGGDSDVWIMTPDGYNHTNLTNHDGYDDTK